MACPGVEGVEGVEVVSACANNGPAAQSSAPTSNAVRANPKITLSLKAENLLGTELLPEF
jgi:hypothetical protein